MPRGMYMYTCIKNVWPLFLTGDVKKAIRRGNSSTIMASLAGGLDIESPDGGTGMTLLMRAVSTGQDAIVKLLISHGANVNAKDYTGNTPLMLACGQVW